MFTGPIGGGRGAIFDTFIQDKGMYLAVTIEEESKAAWKFLQQPLRNRIAYGRCCQQVV